MVFLSILQAFHWILSILPKACSSRYHFYLFYLLEPNGYFRLSLFWFLCLVVPGRRQKFDALFILAELNWNYSTMGRFSGITLLQKLRPYGVKCPVFICSFMPEKALMVKYENRILEFRGHYFIHIPNACTSDIAIEALEDLELEYCMDLCNLEGSIREQSHPKQLRF